MGQYYRFCALNTHKKNASNKDKIAAYMMPWDFDNGAKLMEFSYVGNYYIMAIEALLNKEHGKFAYYNVVFAGDYADEEPNTFNKNKLNLYDLSREFDDKKIGNEWFKANGIEPKHYRYVINETKGKFIDTERMKKTMFEYNPEGLQVHPLPILCCEGCGRGYGDYRRPHRMIGSWARDVVVVSDNRPDEETYKEVFYDFYEKF